RREPRERRGLLRFVWLVLRRRLARAVGVRGLALLQDRRREDEGRGNQRELDLQVGAEAREHTGGLYGQREIRIAADGECPLRGRDRLSLDAAAEEEHGYIGACRARAHALGDGLGIGAAREIHEERAHGVSARERLVEGL